jgi:hypothetical protein
MLQTVILIRNILYKCFLLSFIYYIFVALFYIFNRDWAANLSINLYGIGKHELSIFLVYFIGWMKMFTFYIFLVPALALHWTSAALKKQENIK